ncbi:hypothetical protein Y1Q_0005193 [Alligator mississippiensis]|uniref:Uncharacterized protein n=1 Tax=Alligator mississippiensis TaxID=8496 RepID=A0A151MSY8_ALLMI|nr:hypothetical protein Y1Q_0005193 [Alligator mississippiensis]
MMWQGTRFQSGDHRTSRQEHDWKKKETWENLLDQKEVLLMQRMPWLLKHCFEKFLLCELSGNSRISRRHFRGRNLEKDSWQLV